jgi:hypothetical protein
MCRPLAIALAIGAFVSFRVPLQAACIQQPTAIVAVEVRSCEAAPVYAERVTECLQVKWLRDMQKRMVSRQGGIVIEGKAQATREVTWLAADTVALGPRVPAEETGAWYLAADTGLTCEKLRPGTTIELHQMQLCCDVIPPGNFPCWFGVEQLETIPQVLTEALRER